MRAAFRLYLVTDRRLCGGDGDRLLARLEEALAACPPGLAAVQLRERTLDAAAYLALAERARAVTAARGASLLVSDRVDVALAAAADGVHLPGGGLSPRDVRALWPSALVGASGHDLAEVARAASEGADFAVFGPVFPPSSKASLRPPTGLGGLAAAARTAALPLFALGGIGPANAADALRAGAHGLAFIGAVLSAPSPGRAMEALVRALG